MKSCFTLLVILQIFLDVSSLNLVLDRDINGLKELSKFFLLIINMIHFFHNNPKIYYNKF